eukprot:Gb_04371 [translate_table: standard]
MPPSAIIMAKVQHSIGSTAIRFSLPTPLQTHTLAPITSISSIFIPFIPGTSNERDEARGQRHSTSHSARAGSITLYIQENGNPELRCKEQIGSKLAMGCPSWYMTVFTCFVGAVGWIIFRHLFCCNENSPPGSIGWPLVGETLAFLKPHYSTLRGSFLDHRFERFGRVFKSHLFGQPAIVSCDPDLNAYVLQNENRLFECSYPKAIHGILGELSMLVVVGDAHKRLRSLALNLVNTAKSKQDFLIDIETNALLILDSWKHKQTVMFCEEARKFTFNVIVKQILSLKPESPETPQILKDFLTFMKGLVSLPLYVPGTSYAKAVQSKSRIHCTVKTLMEERRKQPDNERGDFLDMLLTNTSLEDDEIVSLVLDLLLGGYETTAVLIAMVIKFLADSPPALDQLKAEHQAIRRAKEKDEGLSWNDYKHMSFTQNVINEALRCGNVVKFVHRKALKDVKFKGYQIPSGWKVLPIFSAVHLDSSLYKDPLQFNPWRWHEMPITGKQFTPFGGGPRLCPGSELAKVETAFFVHHLVLNFRWRLAEADHSMAHPYVEFEKGLPLCLDRL